MVVVPSLVSDLESVDRSAAYATRYIAKNMVAAGVKVMRDSRTVGTCHWCCRAC